MFHTMFHQLTPCFTPCFTNLHHVSHHVSNHVSKLQCFKQCVAVSPIYTHHAHSHRMNFNSFWEPTTPTSAERFKKSILKSPVYNIKYVKPGAEAQELKGLELQKLHDEIKALHQLVDQRFTDLDNEVTDLVHSHNHIVFTIADFLNYKQNEPPLPNWTVSFITLSCYITPLAFFIVDYTLNT